MLDLITREEVRDAELVGDEDDGLCICCPCRPLVSLCGRFEDGPWLDRGEDEDTCVECLRVEEVGCPGCGCPGGVRCRLCDRRPWWRRWLW